jgi:hypothetical protein
MLPYKSVSWINFHVAAELIAHGQQHLFGLPRLAMECSRVKLLGDLSRGRLPRSPPIHRESVKKSGPATNGTKIRVVWDGYILCPERAIELSPGF